MPMNDDQFKASEELNQEQWWLILFSLVMDVPVKEWNEFASNLIYKNRFSSSHKVVDVIKGSAEKCTTTIGRGQVMYRARIYRQDPLQEFLSDVFGNNAMKKSPENNGKTNEYYNMRLAALMMAIEKGGSKGKEIIDAYNKWQRRKFKGYDLKGSGLPPAEKASAGRLNPEKIRYLYLAEDPRTAIYEVRPTIGQYVSVATFRSIDEIKIFDLAKEIKPQEDEELKIDYSLFNEIQQRFSEPNAGDSYRYLPTQFLGELIKQMGFDGVRFRSSLKSGGINVVLFDDQKCQATCSDIIKVGDIELKFENHEIYQLAEILKLDKTKDGNNCKSTKRRNSIW